MSATHATLIERLRARPGFRLTAQRRAVAEALEAGDHLSAEQVFEAARRALPEISLATVYNTLNELVALGEVQEVALGAARRYGARVHDRHHHLVCDSCGAVLDVEPSGPVPDLPRAERHGFEVRDVEVTYRGTCPACLARRSTS